MKRACLTVRRGPFGEQLELYASRAFAVCDHQFAHVYVADPADVPRVRDVLAGLPGVDRVLSGEERRDIGLRHERSGELIVLSRPRGMVRVSILARRCGRAGLRPRGGHTRKPGYDPCELFIDPEVADPEAARAPAG